MTLTELLNGWLPIVGGVSGLCLLLYMVLMVYFARKKDHDIQALRREIAELKGYMQAKKR